MTEKEFYEEFGNIDPELIEAAAPKAKKGKKILAVRLIAVAACLTVIIISAFMIVPRLVTEEAADIPQEEPKNIERKIFVYNPYASSVDSIEELVPEEYSLKTFYTGGFSASLVTVSDEVDPPEEKERVLAVFGKEYRMTYLKTQTSEALSSRKDGSAIFDRYKDEDIYGRFTIVNRKTGNIALLITEEDDKNPIGATISEEEARDIVKDIIISIYGQELADKYQFSRVVHGETLDAVIFVKYVHGVPTNDEISVDLSHDGRLLTIRAYMLGAYENMEKEVSKVDIESAKEFLISHVNEKATISDDYQIKLHADGKYYLCVSANMPRENYDPRWEEAFVSFDVYVNIN